MIDEPVNVIFVKGEDGHFTTEIVYASGNVRKGVSISDPDVEAHMKARAKARDNGDIS
jgi:hypothetical protein